MHDRQKTNKRRRVNLNLVTHRLSSARVAWQPYQTLPKRYKSE